MSSVPDNRIAPSAPRGAECVKSSVPLTHLRVIGTIITALALCVAVVGAGFATGWLGDPAPSDPIPMPRVISDTSPDDESMFEDTAAEPSENEAETVDDASATDEQAAPASSDPVPSAPDEVSADSAPAVSASAPESVPVPEPTPAPAPSAPSTVTVSVYVDSSRAASYGYPSSLGGGTVTLNQGASVYDALCATGVSVGGSSGYVSSIGGLAEFSCGSGSGWLYFVNGSSPGYGCGSYILNGGENITWIYSCDMGNDL